MTVLHCGHEFTVEWFEHSAHRHIWRHGMRTTDFSLSWQMTHNRFRLLSIFTINVAACSFSFVSFSISIVHSLRIDASIRSTLSGDSLITLMRRRRAEMLLAVEFWEVSLRWAFPSSSYSDDKSLASDSIFHVFNDSMSKAWITRLLCMTMLLRSNDATLQHFEFQVLWSFHATMKSVKRDNFPFFRGRFSFCKSWNLLRTSLQAWQTDRQTDRQTDMKKGLSAFYCSLK